MASQDPITLEIQYEEYVNKCSGLEFPNFVKFVRFQNYRKVEVVGVYDDKTNEVSKDPKDLNVYQSQIDAAFKVKEEVYKDANKELEIERKRTDKLERELQELKAMLNSKKEAVEQNESFDELENARNAYENKFGKKPSHLMKIETILNKINE